MLFARSLRLVLHGAALLVCALAVSRANAQEDLRSENPKRRARAAEELGKQNDSQHIPRLRPLLKDSDRAVRAEAAAAIVAIGTQHSLEPLLEAARDAEPAIQILAVDGLVNFYYPGYVQSGWTAGLKKFGSSLKSRFAEPNVQVVETYVTASPEVVEAIGRVAVGGTSLEARALAARALGVLRARAAVPQLLETLRTKDSGVILDSLRALEKIGDRSAGAGFQFLLRDLDEPVQIAALDATGQLQNREAIPVLQQVLADTGSSKVRRAALTALAKMPDRSSRELFLISLKDRDKYLRAAAAEGLGRLGEAAAVPLLKQAFGQEDNRSARLSMAFALIRFGDRGYLPHLLDALNSTIHRGEARPFLIELARDPALLALLYEPLKKGSNEQKKGLAQVLGASGTAESLTHLENLSEDPNLEVAREAVEASKSLRARL